MSLATNLKCPRQKSSTKHKRRGTKRWREKQWRKQPFCFLCEKPFANPAEATVDHWIPLSKGGYSKRSNYRLVCRACNHAKANKMPGTSLTQGETP